MTLEDIQKKYGLKPLEKGYAKAFISSLKKDLGQNDAANANEDAEIKKKKEEIKKLLLEIKALGAASEKRTGKVNILARGILNTMKA
ncbi:MAG: hypothetical protein IKS96_07215 [Fibrobacter sp.]|nr:hypothetical protein [Fibrobacter sp.]MBR6449717.1 hypothetical protein [Fibrobacter sp.]